MKQRVEEILDSLIVAHHIETPNQNDSYIKFLQAGKNLLLAASIFVAATGVLMLPGQITVNSTVQDRELPIYSVQTAKPQVSLTFDSAWGNQDMEEILKILKKHNVVATFFVTGSWVKNYPEEVKAIIAAGHDLGNHSQNHKNMSRLTDREKKEEIMSLHNEVKELTGLEMFLFRPPYGDYDNAVIRTAYQCGYYPIQWDVDSLDWKDYGVESIIRTVCDHARLGNGSIILCHTGATYTAEALETLIQKLKEKGYEFVPVSELIYPDNYHMDHEGRQIPNGE